MGGNLARVRGIILLLGAALSLPARAQDLTVPIHPEGVTRTTRRAIERGLAFLAKSQNKDGSWRSGGGFGSYPVAMTALAGLAFVASGSTTVRGPYAKEVRRAVGFCLARQTPSGLITAPQEEGRSMYGHGFSMLFLAQVYGMEEDLPRQRRIREVLRRAIALTVRAQSKDGGWTYVPDMNSDEGSVTVTQIQALRACRNAGLHVPKTTIDRAVRYIERSQQGDGGIAYSVHSRGSRPAITAAACAVLYNAGAYDSKIAKRAFAYAWRTCQPTAGSNFFYYTQLYMSQATWQMGDAYWKKYYPAVQRVLVRLQQGNGSWSGEMVGLVYGTSVALLILQIPYNHLPILSR